MSNLYHPATYDMAIAQHEQNLRDAARHRLGHQARQAQREQTQPRRERKLPRLLPLFTRPREA